MPGLGWFILVPGLVMYGGYIVYVLIADDASPTFFKVFFVAILSGLAFLLGSVLRQRIRERKTDRYEDVQL